MEWSVSSGNSMFRPSMEETEGGIRASAMIRDGIDEDPPDVVVSADSQPGRLVVRSGGNQTIAHVSRVGDAWWVHMDGRAQVVHIHEKGSGNAIKDDGALTAPMPGTILQLMVKEGQRVREGQDLMVLEAMKMEHRIKSPKAGEVTKLHYQQGERVDMGSVLAEIGD